MAKDLFHEAVKTALKNDGWTITHDPYIYLNENGLPKNERLNIAF